MEECPTLRDDTHSHQTPLTTLSRRADPRGTLQKMQAIESRMQSLSHKWYVYREAFGDGSARHSKGQVHDKRDHEGASRQIQTQQNSHTRQSPITK